MEQSILYINLMTKQQLQDELNKLSLEELFELGVSVWNRMDELMQDKGMDTTDPELLRELKAMQREVDEGRVNMLPWDKVQQEINARRTK